MVKESLAKPHVKDENVHRSFKSATPVHNLDPQIY